MLSEKEGEESRISDTSCEKSLCTCLIGETTFHRTTFGNNQITFEKINKLWDWFCIGRA
ncbi:hypothetical protein DPMN_113147 [Dreissena polymorpha]|uniref:Uncharacterized protein n=1 Tax=Dreissena polymorpha TaxID=45954 RepID=A0A9D4QQK4_DREPO|nr:hypothetical protein DPMN_113147 [Dreissena polymorpha]